jgi:predicted nucleic acid-binding protein
VIAYAETSAVLTWLLGETREHEVRTSFARAQRVAASTLTIVECRRALTRGAVTGRITRVDELAALKLLDIVSATWVTIEMAG